MSWQTGTTADKLNVEGAIRALGIMGDLRIDHEQQLRAAQRAAIELSRFVPGPKVHVQLSGHVKLTADDGPDFISVSVVSQP